MTRKCPAIAVESAAMHDALIILCTCPDEETAARLANGLVEKRHAACVNILPGIRSIYRWRDGVNDEKEVLMVIKTTSHHFFAVEHWIEEHHPYDIPEVVALQAEHVSDPYFQWLRNTVSV